MKVCSSPASCPYYNTVWSQGYYRIKATVFIFRKKSGFSGKGRQLLMLQWHTRILCSVMIIMPVEFSVCTCFTNNSSERGWFFCGMMMVSCIQRGKLFTNFTSIYGIMKDKAFRSLTFLNGDFSVSLDISVFPLQILHSHPHVGRTHMKLNLLTYNTLRITFNYLECVYPT